MKRNRICFAFGISLLVLVIGVFLFGGIERSVSAQQGATPPPPGALPQNEPERGLIYDGLERAAACGGAFRVVGTTRCSHGPDAPLFSLRVEETVAPFVESGRVVNFKCDGDGTSGNRIQALYVRATDRPDRYNQYLASFRGWLAEMDLIYQHSAAETGGVRRVRFVHGADCAPTIDNVVLSTNGDDNFANTIDELVAKGYKQSNRKYLIFMDANVYCGIGTLMMDDSPGASNYNNTGPDWGRTDAGCWSGFVPSHELNHNLGSVQNSAPNSTAKQNSGGHCSDDYDVMCYRDAPGVVMTIACGNGEHEMILDCNHNDYFHTNPPRRSYLASHWNTANNQFLVASTPTCNPTLSVTEHPLRVASDRITIKWNIGGVGCSNVTHTDVSWDTVSRAGQAASKYTYPESWGEEQSGAPGDYAETIILSEHFAVVPTQIFFVVHAFLQDAGEVTTNEIEISDRTRTPTPSRTPTITVTPTLTRTPTGTSCAVVPDAPQLVSPPKQPPVAKTKVLLDWADATCAQWYNVQVRDGAKRGVPVHSKDNLSISQSRMKKLAAGKTYWWRVEACNAIGCTKSKWGKFSKSP